MLIKVQEQGTLTPNLITARRLGRADGATGGWSFAVLSSTHKLFFTLTADTRAGTIGGSVYSHCAHSTPFFRGVAPVWYDGGVITDGKIVVLCCKLNLKQDLQTTSLHKWCKPQLNRIENKCQTHHWYTTEDWFRTNDNLTSTLLYLYLPVSLQSVSWAIISPVNTVSYDLLVLI